MAKKKSIQESIDGWNKAIDEGFKKQREIDEKLSPSVGQMRYIVDSTRTMYELAQLMNNASNMAHQGIIDFEMAQKILDVQKKHIEKNIEYLQGYLKED